MFIGPDPINYSIDFPNIPANEVIVYVVTGTEWSFNLQINGTGETQRAPASGNTGSTPGTVFKQTFSGLTELNKLTFSSINAGAPGGSACGISAVLVDGVALLDGTGIEPRGTVGSVDINAKDDDPFPNPSALGVQRMTVTL